MTAFPSYMEMRQRVPRRAWDVIRVGVLAAAIALCVVLVLEPTRALHLFWRYVIPVLPIVFLLAPGLWRNVCPLATANQAPRRLGLSRAATAPDLL
jgi:nitrite reductase (NADH) large subunit